MPIYEYRCEKCGEHVEVLQKMSDAPLKTCKRCGEEALQRVMSRTSFVLKGSGWYATDYGSSSKGAGAKGSESKDAGSKDSGASGSKDASSSGSGGSDSSASKSTTETKAPASDAGKKTGA